MMLCCLTMSATATVYQKAVWARNWQEAYLIMFAALAPTFARSCLLIYLPAFHQRIFWSVHP